MTRKNALTRPLAAYGAVACMALLLTGCAGGNEANGEYYLVPDRDDRVEAQLVIDGSDVAVYSFECAEGEDDRAVIEEEPSATGQLTDDGTQVVWSSEDEHIATDSTGGTVTFSLSTAGETRAVTIGDFEFRSSELSEDEIVSTYDGMC